MELRTIPALSYVLELLRYKWQILSFVRCKNIEMKDWSKLSQNSYGLKRITWISDGVIQFLTNILPVSHFNPVKPAAQRQRYPCGKNPDWHVPPFIQGVVPHEFWEMINGIKKFKSDWSRQEDYGKVREESMNVILSGMNVTHYCHSFSQFPLNEATWRTSALHRNMLIW